MSQTPHDQAPHEQAPSEQAPSDQGAGERPAQDRVDTEHLRDYSGYRRSVADRRIAGVAGGLGRHLNIDPVIVRVAFVVLAFFGGAGLLLYAAAWLFVPDDSGEPAKVHLSDSGRNVLLIIVGAIAVLLAIGDSWGGWGPPWWLALVTLGVFAVLMTRDNRPTPPRPPTAGAPPPVSYAPVPPPRSRGSGSPTSGSPASGPSTSGYGAPYATPVGTQPAYAWQPVTPVVSYEPPTPSKAELRRQRGPILFWFTLALLGAGLGALGLYEASGHAVTDAAYPALALAIIGVMLLVGAWYGRPGGLVALGLLSTMSLAATAVAEPSYDGDRALLVRPVSAADLESSYFVPAGELVLDLRRLDDPASVAGKDIELRGNAGHIKVLLPGDLGANVDARIGLAGTIEVNGPRITGPVADQGLGAEVATTLGTSASPRVDLDIRLGAGFIEIEQQEAA